MFGSLRRGLAKGLAFGGRCGVDFPDEFLDTNYIDKQRGPMVQSSLDCPASTTFVRNALKLLSDMHITEGTVLKLQCPEAKCGDMITPGLLKRLLGKEEFEHWESLMLEKTLESMTDVVCCPRCETPCLEDKDDHAQCSKCYYSFCTLEASLEHSLLAAQLEIEPEKTSETPEKKPEEPKATDKQVPTSEAEKKLSKEKPSEVSIEKTKLPVEENAAVDEEKEAAKDENEEKAARAISGYDHFRSGTCELFPTEEIQRWEAEMNGRQIVGQIQAQLFANHGHSCPNCGGKQQSRFLLGIRAKIIIATCVGRWYDAVQSTMVPKAASNTRLDNRPYPLQLIGRFTSGLPYAVVGLCRGDWIKVKCSNRPMSNLSKKNGKEGCRSH
ncbi:hypothetical protein SASPL_126906 [Salvia splendens]|uniref:E3 ubiquitin-protein ligase RNF14 n=1 Tax=Salvia splendens TaxID=180675 RepID=A0A8X8XII8_SALSN|nr:hypothetical protein SASPL_126906 [Salvia splendens]